MGGEHNAETHEAIFSGRKEGTGPARQSYYPRPSRRSIPQNPSIDTQDSEDTLT